MLRVRVPSPAFAHSPHLKSTRADRGRAGASGVGSRSGVRWRAGSARHDPARVGSDLRATAWATDGCVEALEHVAADRFLIGVQWHPEWQRDEARHLALFRALVDAARARMR